MMQSSNDTKTAGGLKRQSESDFLKSLARAFGGAILFTLPLLMTMEMWWLGFYMAKWKLALLLVLTIPFLIGLSYFSGFRQTFDLMEDALDAFVAYAVGFAAAIPVLFLFSVINAETSFQEIIGMVSLQAIPGSMGALLAQTQLGGEQNEHSRHPTHAGEMFIMLAGALYLSFNLAPTEEMVLIAFQMNSWQLLTLALLSIAIMHAFVYALEFKGQEAVPEGTSMRSIFMRYTIVGYSIALLISLYCLWSFGRTDGMEEYQILKCTVVLAFPASVGAAAARLLI